jgi:hypothetical protein
MKAIFCGTNLPCLFSEPVPFSNDDFGGHYYAILTFTFVQDNLQAYVLLLSVTCTCDNWTHPTAVHILDTREVDLKQNEGIECINN